MIAAKINKLKHLRKLSEDENYHKHLQIKINMNYCL